MFNPVAQQSVTLFQLCYFQPDVDNKEKGIKWSCAKWVKDAWDLIPSEMIKKSFIKSGISNAMDGTEDDAIYEDDDEDNSTSDDSADTDSENDIYADDVTDEQFYQLFGHSIDEYSDFEGFE
ncbi:hypothetical protein Btru_071295 [Bulinus truncatus]|nr:hypothetical protein Btru_071295 [Bulinus truncatus]